MLLMLSDDSFDFSASFLISSATTVNPLPASPALAASIDAFRASKLVWSYIFFIKSVITLISFIFTSKPPILSITPLKDCNKEFMD